MSDEKHLSISNRGRSNTASHNLALVAVEFAGPFELSSSPEPLVETLLKEKAAQKASNKDAAKEYSARGARNRSRKPRGKAHAEPPPSSHLNEEYYLSAALAEEGSRPSLAFVFPPLAKAIEDATLEARSTSTTFRKPTGRAHLHVIEGSDSHDLRTGRDPFEIEPPDRNYDCRNYDTCLGLAAALNWSSFTCAGCTGTVNKHLLWRAHSEVRKNKTLAELCDLPDIQGDAGAEGEAGAPSQIEDAPLEDTFE